MRLTDSPNTTDNRPEKRRRSNPLGWIGLGVAALVLVLLLRRGGQKAPAAPVAQEIFAVEAIEVGLRLVQNENALTGAVAPFRSATVAAQVSERVASRAVGVGDRIDAGGLLIEQDSDTAQAQLQSAQADIAASLAARRQSESELARVSVETSAELRRASANFAGAQAARRGAQDDYSRVSEEVASQRASARQRLIQANANAQRTRNQTRTQELRAAEAALQDARAAEKLAEIELRRYEYAAREGAVATQLLDRARADYEIALARRRSEEQDLSLAREGARREDQISADAGVRDARTAVRSADAGLSRLASLREGLDERRATERQALAGVESARARPLRLASLQRQIESQRAQEAGSRARARQASVQLARHVVRAPFAGRVLTMPVEAGETVGPGQTIAQIGDISRVEVSFSVPENSRAGLRRGQVMEVRADAVPRRRFRGRVTTLGFDASAQTRGFVLGVTVENPDEALLPGMVARVSLPVGRAALRLTVPISTIANDGAATSLFVLRERDGFTLAARRDVQLGAPDGADVEVTQGLKQGDRVAASPSRLIDDSPVRVVKIRRAAPLQTSNSPADDPSNLPASGTSGDENGASGTSGGTSGGAGGNVGSGAMSGGSSGGATGASAQSGTSGQSGGTSGATSQSGGSSQSANGDGGAAGQSDASGANQGSVAGQNQGAGDKRELAGHFAQQSARRGNPERRQRGNRRRDGSRTR